ncbi:telomere length regulation protein TEL2 homolog isoform X1 [Morus notabilis]|uniref:telomere length regulation protein TEL2 homolog isoform X1 n=1 Tax=Morus notabilis TaxID=981085 RepID=UPI000CED4D23|nr:telomere length regulation protein TEL2 homolog isoform X1 [Morus notabilis]
MADDSPKRKRALEAQVLEVVGEVISAINSAKHVDHVICALHSMTVLLFPLDSSLVSGSLDEKYRDQILSAKAPSAVERSEWWQAFYRGAAFPTVARVLLREVASNWLACFPISARKHVYDVFFVKGLVTEVVQALVPCLQQIGTDGLDVSAVCSNTERLVILCLLENDGVAQMAREFGCPSQTADSGDVPSKATISMVAQIIASIPDKAQLGAPVSLSSHSFFKQITIQLLSLAEEKNLNLSNGGATIHIRDVDGTFLFVGETFSRICRRGSVDVFASEVVPRVLRHVQRLLSSTVDSLVLDVIDSNPASQFWLNMMLSVNDSYAVERMSEQLLHELATQRVSDVEAYWVLWLLFHRIFAQQASLRSMFVDKFLFWKVFPVRCVRWILHFALLESPPNANLIPNVNNTHNFLEALQRLVLVWSKREFVQSATVEQQIYVSAAVGLSLEKMSKEELNEVKDVMNSILQGVSYRLESPNDLVRKMASSVALVFSKVIDPKNPLYLDDSCSGETIDWEFGLTTSEKGPLTTTNCVGSGVNVKSSSTSELEKDVNHLPDDDIRNKVKRKKEKVSEYKLVDPDEIIDPINLNCDSGSDKDDYDDDDDTRSENSDTSSDSSLQPYDLSDDDTDLKRKFTQLVDVVGALRKSDDADGVEKALDIAESLVRASPDELRHVASDLTRTLVQVRCSDLAVEGEEESAEDKRQRTLVALVVMCPFESLDTLNNLLYSPNVDISQRIMILDVMTNAAQELAYTKTMRPKHQTRPLISTISETQAWFLPSDVGPPGAGSWKEVSERGTLLNWENRYERELPPKPGQIKKGKTRRWSVRSANVQENQIEWSRNKFPMYAAAFMLPAMQGFDKKRHGVDLLNRDFIVLGKLIYMLGVCMKCAAMHPEASALAPPLLDMLGTREICHHKEAYVRRAVLFAASCILASLHPSYVVSALTEGNLEISRGLEWVRTWALHVAESDTDRECYMMAMTCLQLHAEMALQASRALESTQSTLKSANSGLTSHVSKGTIKIPSSNALH